MIIEYNIPIYNTSNTSITYTVTLNKYHKVKTVMLLLLLLLANTNDYYSMFTN